MLLIGSCSFDKTEISDNKIVVGTKEIIHSAILNEEREVWVYIPNSNNLYAKQNYPVIYLLDGDRHFYSVMGMIQQLSEANWNMVLPQMIVVGITNTDRTRDLSPSHVSFDPYSNDSLSLKTSGGAESFTSFLEKELIPHIDSLYPTAPYKMLIGHSFGGLFVMNTLINHTDLFNSYIAIDPNMDWDNQKLLKQAKTVLAEKDFEGSSLFLAIANSIDENLDTLKVRGDTTLMTLSLRSVLELGSILDANKQNKLKYNWKYYPNDIHNSVPMIAEYDGLRFIMDFYDLRVYFSQDSDPSFRFDSMLRTHFDNISQHIGYKYSPPESFVDMVAKYYAGYNRPDIALGLLKMNVENFPTSENTYISMGEFLTLKGDTIGAIKQYEEALKLNPTNENAKNMIKKLNKKTQ